MKLAVEQAALLLRIREVPGSNLTDAFRQFSQSLQVNIGTVPKVRPRPLPTVFFPIQA
jgi:hypothetical protein